MAVLSSWWVYFLAFVCITSAIGVSIFQILCHLRLYNEPLFQRYIIRIIFLVPVYAVASFLCLADPVNALYYDAPREIYEAWMLYNFLALLLAYIGGPGAVETKMAGTSLKPSLLLCTCFLPPLPVNGAFVKTAKRFLLQFVFIKPVLVVLKVVLYATGNLEEGNWSPTNGLIWLVIALNVTYAIALSGLMLFYRGTHELLQPYKPLLKFVLIKAVVFLTFWQGLALAILAAWGVLESAEEAFRIRSFFLCVEMLPAAGLLIFAFPWGIYSIAGQPAGIKASAVFHALSFSDVFHDAFYHFSPTYNAYTLYSDGQEVVSQHRGKARTSSMGGGRGNGEEEAMGQPQSARSQDKTSLLSSMEMGGQWKTMEEGVVGDFNTYTTLPHITELPELQLCHRTPTYAHDDDSAAHTLHTFAAQSNLNSPRDDSQPGSAQGSVVIHPSEHTWGSSKGTSPRLGSHRSPSSVYGSPREVLFGHSRQTSVGTTVYDELQ